MAYSYTHKLRFPLEKYRIDRGFLKKCNYRNERGKWENWGLHLGEDYNEQPNTPVFAIGKGRVIYSKLHPGNHSKRNWGNIIIIAHKNPVDKNVFFSLYGHLNERLVERGDKVKFGQKIGTIAPKNSKENGWWGETHLHFAIYKGLWRDSVLPGYYRENQKRTKISDWAKPNRFIREYNKQTKKEG